MKNLRLNQSQQQLAEEYNSFSKTVVVASFHFVAGKELSTGYCLEDAYQEASLALCMAAAHFNYERGVLFKTYAAAVIRNHLKKVMFSKSVTEIPLEDISDSTDITYEMDAHLEYLEMLSHLKTQDAKQKPKPCVIVGLIVSSQTGYMMRVPEEVEQQILTTPTEELMALDYVKNVAMQNSGTAYIFAKRVNHLQATKAAATTWKARRARINTISPGVIVTPLAYDEFAAAGDAYQQMIDASAAMRTGSSDEIAEAGAFLLSDKAGFINGTDLLIDGGTIAAIRTGEYQLHVE